MTYVEQWRPVVGFEGLYEVSDMGRVRFTRVIKPFPSRRGYPVVTLSRNGKKHLRRNHRLVAEAFIGPCPPGQEVRHLDGDTNNARLGNLQYGTRADNEADKVLHNKSNRGARHGMAKLTEVDIVCIRSLIEQKVPGRTIANQFGISQGYVYLIGKGKAWKHVPHV